MNDVKVVKEIETKRSPIIYIQSLSAYYKSGCRNIFSKLNFDFNFLLTISNRKNLHSQLLKDCSVFILNVMFYPKVKYQS